MLEEIKTVQDTETGQVYSTKKRQYNILDEKKGYYFRYNSGSVKQYKDIKLSEFIKDRKDFMRIHLLAENIYKSSNELMVRVSTRKIRYMTIEDIAEVVGLCERKATAFINRMIRMEVIARQINQVGESELIVYVMNPLFFNSCKYLPPNLYFLFESSLKPYIPQNIQEWYHEVGSISKEQKGVV